MSTIMNGDGNYACAGGAESQAMCSHEIWCDQKICSHAIPKCSHIWCEHFFMRTILHPKNFQWLRRTQNFNEVVTCIQLSV